MLFDLEHFIRCIKNWLAWKNEACRNERNEWKQGAHNESTKHCQMAPSQMVWHTHKSHSQGHGDIQTKIIFFSFFLNWKRRWQNAKDSVQIQQYGLS